MSRIRILPEILSNKIAAGEVVERPASVVKELVENALDAGSSRILLALEQAGKALIRISDNGTGMNRDEALLAIERYATSKLVTDADLFAIRSLGFRGEALPSIASVSRLTLESRDADSEVGTQVQVHGGKIVGVANAGMPVGTQVSVRQLFFNTPARRKFLKTVHTEMGHVMDVLSSIALAWPNTGFQLTHNGKPMKNWAAAPDALDRVSDVVGHAVKEDLMPVSFSRDGVGVEGWICSGRTVRSTSRGIYLYVNRRFVKDSLLRHALMAGFSGRIITGRYPVAVLFVTVPPGMVDVNVHPTKHAVRFAEPKAVHRMVETAVAQSLQRLDRPFRRTVETPAPVKQPPDRPPMATAAEPVASFFPRPVAAPFVPEPSPSALVKQQPVGDAPPIAAPPARSSRADTVQQSLFEDARSFADLRIIGQLRDTYIVCESPRDGMILVDQHAAHERILFEAFKQRAATVVSVQRLLMPETVEVGYNEARILDALLPDLGKFGLDIDPFGGETFVIKAVPALLSGREAAPLVREIVEKAADSGITPGLDSALDQIRHLMACHGAIRAGQRLSMEQMRALLHQLDGCDAPATCPHGRPTWIHWKIGAIEKAFHRIV